MPLAEPADDEVRAMFEQIIAEIERPRSQRTRRTPGRRPSEPATYRVRVDLDDSVPPIWRRLELRSTMTLDVLHEVLQHAFSWTDSHLHRFAIGDSVFDTDAEKFLCPFDVEEGDTDGVAENTIRLDEVLSAPGDELRYGYDYGDDWGHTVVLEAIEAPDPDARVAVCLGGDRAAPPEDCLGLRTATELATVLDDPAHFDVAEINRALDDPFLVLSEVVHPDLAALLLRLRTTAVGKRLGNVARDCRSARTPRASSSERDQALQSMLWFLDWVGPAGRSLTAAGYLRPAEVKIVAVVVVDEQRWPFPPGREVDTLPVLHFRLLLRRLGLVRRHKGRLVRTRAGDAATGDPQALWDHLVSRLPLGEPDSAGVVVQWLTLLLATPPGPLPDDDLEVVAVALNALGWRSGDGEPIDARVVRFELEDLDELLWVLGGTSWSAGDHRVVSDLAAAVITRRRR